jgi:hypothetical protein
MKKDHDKETPLTQVKKLCHAGECIGGFARGLGWLNEWLHVWVAGNCHTVIMNSHCDGRTRIGVERTVSEMNNSW